MANIGKNIKQFRMKKNYTQDELAEQLFVSRQTVSNYENNKSNPDIDMLVKIAEVLGTDVNALIYGTPETVNRKKQIIREIIITGIVLLLGIAILKGNEFLVDIKKKYFEVFPLFDYTLTIKTAYVIFLGWYVMDLFFFFFQVQPLKRKLGKGIRLGVIIILACYIIFVAPYLFWQTQYWLSYAIHGFDYAITYYGSYDPLWGMDAIFVLEIMYVGWYVLFMIPGILLRISGHVKND